MSDSGPPPESGQLMSTGDSVQADQSIKWDFLKQQTVTLTLNLNDILKNGNQSLLNNCEFSVSGRMAFTCKNCIEKESAVHQTLLADSTPENVRVQDNNSAPQPPQHEQQEVCDSESQKVVNSINKSQATLNKASGLLLNCSETLEKLKAELDVSSESDERSKKIKKVADSEVKRTTSKVIRMLEELGKDTGTVDSNDDDDDKPPSDDDDCDRSGDDNKKQPSDNEDTDGSGKRSEDPKGPTNPPDDPSKRDEATTEIHPTDPIEEQTDHESTESELAETTTTEIDVNASRQEKQSELTESTSASEIDKKETGEAQKQGEDDSEPQQVKDKLGGSSEEAPKAGSDPQQEDGFPQKPPTFEDPLLSKSTANQTVLEELKDTSPEDVEVLASVRDESGHDEPSLPASEIDNKEGDSEETTDAGSDPNQQAKLPQQSSTPAESVIEPKSDDNEALLLAREEVVEVEQQGGDESEIQKIKSKLGRNSEEAQNTGFDPQHKAELPQDPSIPAVPVIEEPADDNRAGNDGSEDNVVAQPVQQVGNVPGDDNVKKDRKSRRKISKANNSQRQQENRKKIINVEIDRNDVSMEMMLFAFLEKMNTILNEQTDPNDNKLPHLLEEISLFYMSKHYKQVNIEPEVGFKKMFGNDWQEKSDTRREICKKLVYFAGQESLKTSAQNMIAYIHHQYKKGNSNQGSSNNLVTSVNDFYPKFVSEIHVWIDDHWVNRVYKYIKYQQQLEEQTQCHFWKGELTWFNEDPRVLQRIDDCKAQFEQNRNLENRLIFECYKYLISHQNRFNDVHKTLDFDLDYILTRPEATIRITELKFFKAVYGLNKDMLERLIEEETKCGNELDKPEPENIKDTPSVPAESALLSTTRSEEEDKRYRALCMIPHNLNIFLPMISTATRNPPLISTATQNRSKNDSDLFTEICVFHTTEVWEKYETMTPDTLILKLFGPKEKWGNMHEENQQFCKFLEESLKNEKLRDAAFKMLAYMEYYITEQSNKQGIDRESFAQLFLQNVNTNLHEWLLLKRLLQLATYVNHRENCKNKFEEQDEYCWKPKPAHFKMSPRLEERFVYHLNKPENFNSHNIAECYYVLKHWIGESQILDEDLDFIFTRSEEMIEKAEKDFFLVVCPTFSVHVD